MILFAVKRKLNAAEIDALKIAARHHVIAGINVHPETEAALQGIYNGMADIIRLRNNKEIKTGLLNIIKHNRRRINTMFDDAPAFDLNDEAFEKWRLKKGEKMRQVYFGFSDNWSIRRTMQKVNLITGAPGDIIVLANKIGTA